MRAGSESRAWWAAAFVGLLLAAALAGCDRVRRPTSAEAEQACAKVAHEIAGDGTSVATVAAAFDTDLAGMRRVAMRTGPQDPDIEDELNRWGVDDPAARAVICYVDFAPQDGAPVERLVVGSLLPAAGAAGAREVIDSGPPNEIPAAMP